MIISHLCEAIAREVWTEFVCDTNSHETCNSLEREPGGGGGKDTRKTETYVLCLLSGAHCGPSRGYKESHSYLMERRSVGFLSGKTSLAVELYIFFKKRKEKKENTENMRAYTCIIQSTQLGVKAWSD